MEELKRTEKIPFDVFVKRSWPLFAIGAVFILLASGGLLWFALSGKGRKATIPTAEATSTEVVVASSTATLVPRALDGVLVEPTDAHLLPFAVMIDNQPDARPSSGVSKASLVYEIPVEGGLTRYMAVFDATTTVDQIGPVRSARPYFVELANSLGALYAHVGGSPDALDKIKQTSGFRNVDEMANENTFWRSKSRPAPHNAYTRSDLLRALATKKNWQASQWHSWDFKDDESATGTTRGTMQGPKVEYGGEAGVAWSYDKNTNAYERSLNGRKHIELDGAHVVAKNVVVMLTDATVTDEKGRLSLRTTGRGKALLFRDGNVYRLSWTRTASGALQFEAVDGTAVLFNRGMTWVNVVTDPVMFAGADPKGNS